MIIIFLIENRWPPQIQEQQGDKKNKINFVDIFAIANKNKNLVRCPVARNHPLHNFINNCY